MKTYYISFVVDDVISADYFDIHLDTHNFICPDNIKSELNLPERAIIIGWQLIN